MPPSSQGSRSFQKYNLILSAVVDLIIARETQVPRFLFLEMDTRSPPPSPRLFAVPKLRPSEAEAAKQTFTVGSLFMNSMFGNSGVFEGCGENDLLFLSE